MTDKTCSKCLAVKSIDDFYNQRDGRLGKTSRCKMCMTAYRRSVVEQSTEWHKDNYRRNKARFNALHKTYREVHAEKLKEGRRTPDYKLKKARWDRAHYERHTEALIMRSRASALNNPDTYRAYKNSYKAKQRAAFVEFVDLASIYERDMGLCQICGLVVENDDFSLDHRIPIALGGKHSMENCQTSHLTCNTRKQDKRPEQCTHLWLRS